MINLLAAPQGRRRVLGHLEGSFSNEEEHTQQFHTHTHTHTRLLRTPLRHTNEALGNFNGKTDDVSNSIMVRLFMLRGSLMRKRERHASCGQIWKKKRRFHCLFVIEFTSQSRPSCRPTPCTADVLKIDHSRSFRALKPRASDTWTSVAAPLKGRCFRKKSRVQKAGEPPNLVC